MRKEGKISEMVYEKLKGECPSKIEELRRLKA